MELNGKYVLITGAAVRLGRAMALAVAGAGGNLIIHFGHSEKDAVILQKEAQGLGVEAHLLQADLSQLASVAGLIQHAVQFGPLFALVNSAAIFEKLTLESTDLEGWQRHLDINLTAPFLLSQAFWNAIKQTGAEGRIVNILDWRALRPGLDHLPYSVSKAALAALTQGLAVSMAPKVTVNGIAFGAVLPPTDGGDTKNILKRVPAGRWAELDEVGQTLLFLLTGPQYITGEIIHLDGGRHLV